MISVLGVNHLVCFLGTYILHSTKRTLPPPSIFRIFLAEAACCPWLSFLLSNTPVSRHTTVLKKERPCFPASLVAKCGPVIKLRLMRSKQKDQSVASGNLTWDLGDMWPLPLSTSPLLMPGSRCNVDHEHEVIPYGKQPRELFKDFLEQSHPTSPALFLSAFTCETSPPIAWSLLFKFVSFGDFAVTWT